MAYIASTALPFQKKKVDDWTKRRNHPILLVSWPFSGKEKRFVNGLVRNRQSKEGMNLPEKNDRVFLSDILHAVVP